MHRQIVNTNTGSSVQSILQLQVGSDRYVNFATNYTNQYLQTQGVNITSHYYDFNSHIFRNNSGTESFTIDSSGSCNVKGGELLLTKQGSLNKIEVGSGQNANNYAYIDLIGDSTYSDYGLRLIRNNSGANTSSFIYHRGTGALALEAQDTGGYIKMSTAGTERVRITNTGVGIGMTPAEVLDLTAASGDTRLRLNAASGADTEIKFGSNHPRVLITGFKANLSGYLSSSRVSLSPFDLAVTT